MPAPTTKVERKIYFYRMDSEQTFFGQPVPVDPGDIIRHIKRLIESGEHHWTNSNFITTGCWLNREAPPQRLRFGTIRSSGLPHIERAGALSPIGENEIIELVHVVFFANQIVGVEFNPYGPRLPRLGAYLSATGYRPHINFLPLLEQDAARKLDKLEPIRLLQLKIRPSFAEIIAQADEDLGSAFTAARRATEAEEIEIVLKPRAYSRRWLANRLIPIVRTLARREEIHDDVLRFDVKGLNIETGRVELVDVLSDQLITKKKIALQNEDSEALESASAYEAIEEAYTELQEKLIIATGVRL